MTSISFKHLLALIFFFALFKLSFELQSNDEVKNKRATKIMKKQRTTHLMSQAENLTISLFNDQKQRFISGEQEINIRQSSRYRTGRQYISIRRYLPLLDGILFGDFCSRPMYQAVASACGEVTGYQALMASEQQVVTPTDIASTLVSKNKYKFCEDVVTLAPFGDIYFNSTSRYNQRRQCAFTIFRMDNEYMCLTCTIPRDMNGNGIFKIIGNDKDLSTDGRWQTVYDDYYGFFVGSVTILLQDNGDFVGSMSCKWYNN